MEKNRDPTLQEMLRNLLSIAFPTSLSFLLEFILVFLNLMFIGHLNDKYMTAAIGIGNLILVVVGIGFNIGFNGVVETMVSQSFGNGNMFKCGDTLNKARIMLTINLLIQGFILLNIRPFLELIKIEEEVIVYIEEYLKYMILPMVYMFGLYDANRRYLNCLGYPNVATFIQIISIFIHCIGCYYFIHIQGMNMLGVGISALFTQMFNIVSLTIYCQFKPEIKESWFWPSIDSFKNFREFFTLGMSSAITVVAECGCFEGQSYFACLIGLTEAATQPLILSWTQLMFAIPWGLSVGGSVMVGTSVGENNKRLAKKYSKLVILTGFVSQSIILMLTNLFKHQIPYFYTSQEEIVLLFSGTLPIYSLNLLFDGMQGIQMGLLRGLSQQAFSSVITLFSYYLVCLPLSYLIGIHLGYGLKGMWLGLSLGQIFLVTAAFVYMRCLNWDALIEKRVKALEKEKQHILEQRTPSNESLEEEIELNNNI